MENRDLYYKEHATLRQELHNLKSCQITFLTLSVTATGLLLGLAVKLNYTTSLGLIYLTPLVIVLPCWWVFLDKATTITRIVGYYRILEGLILRQYTAECFIGWENALAKFRQLQLEGNLKVTDRQSKESKLKSLIKLAIFRTTHFYWVITWYTFFGLSVLCLALSWYSLEWTGNMLVYTATIIVVISAFYNARRVWSLIHGQNSYTENEEFWKTVLEVEKVNVNLVKSPNNG